MNRVSIILFLLLSAGCSSNCYIADSIREIQISSSNKVDHFLYLRESGFNEKEFFYELYEKKPIFDECGQSASQPVFQAHVDETQGAVKELKIINKHITIVYSPRLDNDYNLEEIPIFIQSQ